MAYEHITVEVAEGVATVVVNRPKALNALNAATIGELDEALVALTAAPEVRVVILTGAGEKAFVAGADISEMTALDGAGGQSLAERGQRVFHRLETMGKPSIAAINGFALGGGCELALACSIRIAADTARLGLPEVTLGLIPGYGGTQRLPRLVGRGHALELILTGGMVDAARAAEIGLVNRVVPQAELLTTCQKLASKMVAAAPLAVRAGLAAVSEGEGRPLDEALAMEARAFGSLFGTADAHEGVAAFLEKRPPRFEGR
jgi:enoyl-CoA hydratase